MLMVLRPYQMVCVVWGMGGPQVPLGLCPEVPVPMTLALAECLKLSKRCSCSIWQVGRALLGCANSRPMVRAGGF
jgi:hypothetical protein